MNRDARGQTEFGQQTTVSSQGLGELISDGKMKLNGESAHRLRKPKTAKGSRPESSNELLSVCCTWENVSTLLGLFY